MLFLGQMEKPDWTMDWTGLVFFRGVIFFRVGGGGCIISVLVCKKSRFQPFPNGLYFFLWGREVVLYRLYSSLLFVGFVLCLSFLVWVGGLDWSLCLTHGRHVSLES